MTPRDREITGASPAAQNLVEMCRLAEFRNAPGRARTLTRGRWPRWVGPALDVPGARRPPAPTRASTGRWAERAGDPRSAPRTPARLASGRLGQRLPSCADLAVLGRKHPSPQRPVRQGPEPCRRHMGSCHSLDLAREVEDVQVAGRYRAQVLERRRSVPQGREPILPHSIALSLSPGRARTLFVATPSEHGKPATE